jgi:hypothetical protein
MSSKLIWLCRSISSSAFAAIIPSAYSQLAHDFLGLLSFDSSHPLSNTVWSFLDFPPEKFCKEEKYFWIFCLLFRD